jgi:hypothetical protein
MAGAKAKSCREEIDNLFILLELYDKLEWRARRGWHAKEADELADFAGEGNFYLLVLSFGREKESAFFTLMSRRFVFHGHTFF